jgi:hypothetical protein
MPMHAKSSRFVALRPSRESQPLGEKAASGGEVLSSPASWKNHGDWRGDLEYVLEVIHFLRLCVNKFGAFFRLILVRAGPESTISFCFFKHFPGFVSCRARETRLSSLCVIETQYQ